MLLAQLDDNFSGIYIIGYTYSGVVGYCAYHRKVIELVNGSAKVFLCTGIPTYFVYFEKVGRLRCFFEMSRTSNVSSYQKSTVDCLFICIKIGIKSKETYGRRTIWSVRLLRINGLDYQYI